HVADPRLRILGDDQARRHVRRGVLLRVDDEGEAAEVDVGARPHDLLDGRVAHDHRRDPPAAPLEERRDQRLGRDAEPYGMTAGEIATGLATLDLLTGGRTALGLGMHTTKMIEWMGIPVRDRLTRLRESVDVMRRLWRGEVVEYQGREIQWSDQCYL